MKQDHGYAPVYGLAFPLGIKLMPRIRNWKDLKWFRPTLQEAYKNIAPLFTKEAIDWDLIERHLPDMLQVAQSIRAGRISPSSILRRLGTASRKNPYRTSHLNRFGLLELKERNPPPVDYGIRFEI